MSNINVMRKNLGPVTAYKYAVQQGYTGTEQEFAALMASYATVAEEASASAASAAASASAAAESARTLTIDSTLTQPGQPADAKTVGDTAFRYKEASPASYDNLLSKIPFPCSFSVTASSAWADKPVANKTFIFTQFRYSSTFMFQIAYGYGTFSVYYRIVKPSDGTVIYNWTTKQITIDPTLTQEGEAADAKAVGELRSKVHDELMTLTYSNISNSLLWEIDGYYPNGNFSNPARNISAGAKTSILAVSAGENYKVSGRSNFNQKVLCLYDSSDAVIASYSPNNEDVVINDLEVIIPAGAVKMAVSYYDTASASLFRLIKKTYIAKNYAIKGSIDKEDVTFIPLVKSENLFDPSKIVIGKYLKTSDGTVGNANEYIFYEYVPLTESGYYSLIVNAAYFGEANAYKINLYDETYVKVALATAVKISGSGDLTVAKLEITDTHIANGAKYLGLVGAINKANVIMVVKSENYPSEHVSYFEPYYMLDRAVLMETNNPLFGKTVVFDGDSISNGSSANDGSSGWASRIGKNNKMNWMNYSIGGGTIAYIDPTKHCISRYIDTIYANYSELDYLILEGGTNDADLLYSDSSKIGIVNETDFSGTYDDTTFCGALDSLFFKALSYYPKAKIGFVIAPKMGTNPGVRTRRYGFFELAMQSCKKWGIPYINLWDESQLNPSLASMYDSSLSESGNRDGGYLYTDGQHLTANGYAVITPKIEACMKTL